MAKRATTKKINKYKKGISICLGCIEEFKNTDLVYVKIEDPFDIVYTSIFCEKCVKNKNFPQHKKIKILGPVAKPRKKRVTKKK